MICRRASNCIFWIWYGIVMLPLKRMSEGLPRVKHGNCTLLFIPGRRGNSSFFSVGWRVERGWCMVSGWTSVAFEYFSFFFSRPGLSVIEWRQWPVSLDWWDPVCGKIPQPKSWSIHMLMESYKYEGRAAPRALETRWDSEEKGQKCSDRKNKKQKAWLLHLWRITWGNIPLPRRRERYFTLGFTKDHLLFQDT